MGPICHLNSLAFEIGLEVSEDNSIDLNRLTELLSLNTSDLLANDISELWIEHHREYLWQRFIA